MTKTWLITGASSGLGAALAETALRGGNKVIATARNPTKAASEYPQIEELGGKWIELDVRHSDTDKKVAEAISGIGQGKIDVLVNNAGYSLLGCIEDISDEELHAQFDTNVYGPVRVLRGALPAMRQNKGGVVVNISSIAGVDGGPACMAYAGTKFALEGMSESLSKELKPFGIRVLVVEPGAFRTKFLGAYVTPKAGLNKAYEGAPVDKALKMFESKHGEQEGDPVKGAQRIYDVVTGSGMGAGKEGLLRVVIGPDAYARFAAKNKEVAENLEAMKEIANSTSY